MLATAPLTTMSGSAPMGGPYAHVRRVMVGGRARPREDAAARLRVPEETS